MPPDTLRIVDRETERPIAEALVLVVTERWSGQIDGPQREKRVITDALIFHPGMAFTTQRQTGMMLLPLGGGHRNTIQAFLVVANGYAPTWFSRAEARSGGLTWPLRPLPPDEAQRALRDIQVALASKSAARHIVDSWDAQHRGGQEWPLWGALNSHIPLFVELQPEDEAVCRTFVEAGP